MQRIARQPDDGGGEYIVGRQQIVWKDVRSEDVKKEGRRCSLEKNEDPVDDKLCSAMPLRVIPQGISSLGKSWHDLAPKIFTWN